MKKVLAIDGGGVRGIIPAMILAEIEARTKRPVHKLFDVIAGASTGALVAALATRKSGPMSASDIVAAYREDARKYFRSKALFGWFTPKYDGRSVERVLQRRLGESRLSDAVTRIIIPVYALRENVPRVHYFSSLKAAEHPSDNHLLWQVVRGATAAPALFKPFAVSALDGDSEKITVIDGGVFANNPATLGWLHAHHKLRPTYMGRSDNTVLTLGQQFEISSEPDRTVAEILADTMVLSIGTGFANQPVNKKKAARWGKLGWLQSLLYVMYEGQSEEVNAELNIAAESKLVCCFDRLQPQLKESIKAGDASKLHLLEEACKTYIEDHDALIEDICKRLTDDSCGRPGNARPAD